MLKIKPGYDSDPAIAAELTTDFHKHRAMAYIMREEK